MKLKKFAVALFAMLITCIVALADDIISVTVNGVPVAFDQAPIIQEGRTLVPARGVFEAMGASVDWSDTDKSVTVHKGGSEIKLFIGNKTAYVNGAEKTLDVPAQIIEDRTLVPVRFISEAISCTVLWDDAARTVRIAENAGILKVHYIDVGQGDCEFIELPDKKTILIDGGNSGDGEKIASYIRNCGYTGADYLIATHPHADHIGGLPYIVRNMNIGCVYMPNASSTTKTYTDFLNAISEKGVPVYEARDGVNIPIDCAEAYFLAPDGGAYKDLNSYSAVLKLCFGNNKFLFMGDAENDSESRISGDVSADIIKIGHHGSTSSTGQVFLSYVNPKSAVISCGAGNSYGHPHSETLALLQIRGIDVYRTDICGTITAQSDGYNIVLDRNKTEISINAPPVQSVSQQSVQSASQPVAQSSSEVFVTKTGKKYHRDGCRYLSSSKIPISLEEAKKRYSPCSVCNPPQ